MVSVEENACARFIVTSTLKVAPSVCVQAPVALGLLKVPVPLTLKVPVLVKVQAVLLPRVPAAQLAPATEMVPVVALTVPPLMVKVELEARVFVVITTVAPLAATALEKVMTPLTFTVPPEYVCAPAMVWVLFGVLSVPLLTAKVLASVSV